VLLGGRLHHPDDLLLQRMISVQQQRGGQCGGR